MTLLRFYLDEVLGDRMRMVHQVLIAGVIVPAFFADTIYGALQFFNADMYDCRGNYQGEIFYILVLTLAFIHCFVLFFVLIAILLPLCFKKERNNSALLSFQDIDS